MKIPLAVKRRILDADVRIRELEMLLQVVGDYAVRKGAVWRTGEGAEIMDAYDAATRDKTA